MAKPGPDPFDFESFGPDAFLLRFAARGDERAFARCQALLDHLEQFPVPQLIELTPGFTTLLMEFSRGARPDPQSLKAALGRVIRGVRREPPAKRSLEVPVVYDGPDLERVASHAGLSVAEVIQAHTAPLYRVYLLGFAPGFPYLHGLDPRLHTPRLETPRLTVPAGSVAIGGEYCGIYSAPTSGGWNLIGRTEQPLLNLVRPATDARSAFFFQRGDAVRFKVREAR